MVSHINKIIGIDFGTSQSCVAYLNEYEHPIVLRNLDGDWTTPSIVDFSDEKNVLVGVDALSGLVLEPTKTVVDTKLLMGITDYAISYNNEDKSPEDVAAYILKKLVCDFSMNMGDNFSDVIVAVPSYLGEIGCSSIRKACDLANINVVDIISESVATAIYVNSYTKQNENILIYDLGSGLFEVSLVKIENYSIEVLTSKGIYNLGGNAWTRKVVGYIESQISTNEISEKNSNKTIFENINEKAEKAKIQLSSKELVTIPITLNNDTKSIVLTRKKFDEISYDLLEQTFEKVDEVLNYARINEKTIDRIIITGGASRMPQVRTAFIEKYKIEPQITDFSTAVAKGAALYSSGKYELHKDVWNYENSFRAKEEFEEEIKRYSDTRTYFTEEEFKEMCKHTSGFGKIIKKRTQNTKE